MFPWSGHLSLLANPEHSGVAELREILHPMELVQCLLQGVGCAGQGLLGAFFEMGDLDLQENSLLEFAHSCL